MNIRPDICIALRIISLHEYWRRQQEALDAFIKGAVFNGLSIARIMPDGSVETVKLEDFLEDR